MRQTRLAMAIFRYIARHDPDTLEGLTARMRLKEHGEALAKARTAGRPKGGSAP
jgi:hypothetical protein